MPATGNQGFSDKYLTVTEGRLRLQDFEPCI